jgi:hypothetical protein
VSFVGNNSIDHFTSTLTLAERLEAQMMNIVVPENTVLLSYRRRGSCCQLVEALFFQSAC